MRTHLAAASAPARDAFGGRGARPRLPRPREPARRRHGRRRAARGHPFVHARSRAGLQPVEVDRFKRRPRRSRQGAGQRQHHARRPQAACGGNLPRALARALGRHPHDARKLHLPCRRPIGIALGKPRREDRLDDPLIYVRAVHFAATMVVAGVVFFVVFIAEPAFAKAGDRSAPARRRSAAARLVGVDRPWC